MEVSPERRRHSPSEPTGRAELEGDASPPGRIEVPPELLTRLEEELENLDWERALRDLLALIDEITATGSRG